MQAYLENYPLLPVPDAAVLAASYVIRPGADGFTAPRVNVFGPGGVFIGDYSVSTDSAEFALREALAVEPAPVFQVAANGNCAMLDIEAGEVLAAWVGPDVNAGVAA